jgi:hypothetical protein
VIDHNTEKLLQEEIGAALVEALRHVGMWERLVKLRADLESQGCEVSITVSLGEALLEDES